MDLKKWMQFSQGKETQSNASHEIGKTLTTPLKRILEEWDKIKDSGIFDSLDDFKLLFIEKPDGVCFRKYSSYPWSKENFFFGRYDELLDYYKTSLEVPFFLKDQVGRKYGQLTILSLLVKIINKKRVVFAKCLCDCGRECEVNFSRLKEGHIKTCGQHRQKAKDDLLTLFPDLVAEHWDYEKNDELPENVSIASDQEYWWKDDTGSFKLKPCELTKKQSGTSFNEQSILYYCKQIFGSAKSRNKIKIDGKLIEVDVFLEEINVAIEYDGVYWHKQKSEQDSRKEKKLTSQNIFLIRVREKGLPVVNTPMISTIIYDYEEDDFNEIMNLLFERIAQYVETHSIEIAPDLLNKIRGFSLTADAFNRDKLAILDQYRTNYVSDNITKTCLIKYWDYEKNDPLIPQKVSMQDDIYVWFKCPYGFNKRINIKQMIDSIKKVPLGDVVECNQPQKCKECHSFYCPFRSRCVDYVLNPSYYESGDAFSKQCPLIERFFYYRLFVEKANDEYYKYPHCVYSKYVGKCVDSKEEYDAFSIFKKHKSELLTNEELLKKVRNLFHKIDLSSRRILDYSEFNMFLEAFKPAIRSINYKEFDIDEDHQDFLINVIKTCQVLPHVWEDCRAEISETFFEKLKKIMPQYTIELSTKTFSFDELQSIVEEYHPQISNVIFDDKCFTMENRSFLVKTLSSIPFFGSLFRSSRPSWEMTSYRKNVFQTIQEKLGVKEIIIDKDNWFEFIDVDWKQRQQANGFALIFKKKNPDFFINFDHFNITFKDEILREYFTEEIRPVQIYPDFHFQVKFYMGSRRNPRFTDFPFDFRLIKGRVVMF